jgi:hypothetical protein
MPNLIPSETQWSECESVIRRFEDAWRGPERPDPASFLTPDSPHQTELLVELVHADLEFRLRAGEDARAEDYLLRFPALTEQSVKLDLIGAEFVLRSRYRPPVWPEEYWLRFPEHLVDLLSLFPGGEWPVPLTPTRPAGGQHRPLTVVPSVPGYEIQGELGRGGMGVVYKARDLVLRRTVAIKTLGSVPAAESGARFAREAEAIARLDHPHIVPVYEVGEWRAGETGPAVPFFVMKWYPGGNMDDVPAGPGTDVAAHARAVETIAQAVQHAHQRGVLHRDLKPSNILLDEDGRPHVADFGLAGRFDPDAPRTISGGVVGTPAFMAPEQARAPRQVTTAADVYGLGAILYHQLTGQAPFRGDTPLATMDLAANAPPVRPSGLNPAVPRDLDTVCLKCLEKDPARRYASAAELADDLARWRTGRPVLARPVRAWEHALRWVRRHPLVAGMALTTLAALVTSVGILAESNARIREKERETHAAYLRECAMRYKLEEALSREQRTVYLERVASAGRLYGLNQFPQAWWLLDQCPAPLRGWEWRYLDSVRRSTARSVTLADTGGKGGSLAVAPDGSRLAIGPRDPADHRVRILDAATGREERALSGTGPVAFHADSRRLATGRPGGGVRLWDAVDGTDAGVLEIGNQPLRALAFSADGQRLAVATQDSLGIWDMSTRSRVSWEENVREAFAVAFSPDGNRLAVAEPTAVRLRDVYTGRVEGALVGDPVRVDALAFSTDGSRLVTGGPDGRVFVWDVASGRELLALAGAGGGVRGVAWDRDRILALGEAVRLWQPGAE